jgi:hypothetical protein
MLFYTSSEGKFNQFILPFTFSHLYYNENSYVEISIKNYQDYANNNPKEIEFLEKHFSGRFLLRESRIETNGAIRRIVEVPEQSSDVTYIGDIDIFCLRDDVYEHNKSILMNEQLMTVNIKRFKQDRISGCGAFASDFFKYSYSYGQRPLPTSPVHDELLLFKIFKEHNLKMPPTHDPNNAKTYNKYRGLNGIHTSLNRNGKYDYCKSLIPKYDYANEFKKLLATDIYKEFESVCNVEYQKILTNIKNTI